MVRRFRIAIAALPLALSVSACQRVPLLAPTGSTITLTALSTSLPVNGTTQLIAQVIESSGTPPHSGTHVIFTTSLGIVEPSDVVTDINGRAVATFKAGNSNGTATITASSGGATVAAANALKIAVGAAAATSIVASASPSTLPANGGTSTISALVRDASNNVLPGVPVSFSTNAGTLASTLVVADGNGIAQTTLTTNKTATVTATAGSVAAPSGGGTTTVTNQTTVNVNSGPSITFGTVTPAAPVVGQLVLFPITITAPGTTGSPIRTLTVDFGDGRRSDYAPGAATAITASHVYGAAGTYSVTAVATDTNGDVGSTQTAVAVSQSPPPTGTITVNTAAPLHVSSPIQFSVTAAIGTGAPAGTSIASVRLDFGDGSAPFDFGNTTSGTAQHVYPVQGEYRVTLTVTDSNGVTGRSSTNVIIGP